MFITSTFFAPSKSQKVNNEKKYARSFHLNLFFLPLITLFTTKTLGTTTQYKKSDNCFYAMQASRNTPAKVGFNGQAKRDKTYALSIKYLHQISLI
ncbi:MAG: hypothetical protein ACJA0X_003219 [Cyclobacteriaceae bacterium]